jgi:hypothetical protein
MQFVGPVTGLYTGLTPGAHYYVGADGRPATLSALGTGTRYVQKIGIALDATTMLITLSPDFVSAVL